MKNSIKNLSSLSGKTVLVRVDFNVPLKNGAIRDDNRIVAALPTIEYLLSKGAKVVLFSHLGKVSHKDPAQTKIDMEKNNMAPIAVRLGELLNKEVVFVDETRGDKLTAAVKAMKNGDVLLMQNTRYEKGEEKNDATLAAYWASLCDVFVMDAFGSAHRAHASTYGVPEILAKDGRQTAIGLLVEQEIVALQRCVSPDAKPYIAVLGGLKVSDKIKVIEALLAKTDKVIIGGAMAYTFFKAMGYEIGTSPVELDQLDFAKKCLEIAKGKIILPIDVVVTNDYDNPTEEKTVPVTEVPEGFMGMDIGPKTQELFKKELQGAKIVFWNGPSGVFEKEAYAKGTIAVCEAITSVKGAFTVIGGGDSAAAAAQFGYKDKFSHVSTGGGASLEMIENDGHLPGIDIIMDI
jgi:phosphoglycerate kinase